MVYLSRRLAGGSLGGGHWTAGHVEIMRSITRSQVMGFRTFGTKSPSVTSSGSMLHVSPQSRAWIADCASSTVIDIAPVFAANGRQEQLSDDPPTLEIASGGDGHDGALAWGGHLGAGGHSPCEPASTSLPNPPAGASLPAPERSCPPFAVLERWLKPDIEA